MPSATDPELAPPGCSAVFVLVPTPLLSDMPDVDWRQFTAGVRAKVLERLAREGLHSAEDRIEVEETYTPADWKSRFGLYDGSAFGAAHTLLQLGPRRSPNYRRNIRGLFYTGAGTTPGTGVPMVVLSGKMTAERVTMAHTRRSMMHVHRYGTGPDVYFGLHGWAGSHLTYAPIVPHLPPSATLLLRRPSRLRCVTASGHMDGRGHR